MQNILLAVATAGAVGFSGWVVRLWWKYWLKCKQHHQELDKYPELFKRHHEEHVKISGTLSLVQRANVNQMRTQMIQIHETAMKQGKISTYWKSQFYELYAIYHEMGGNGFVEQLKQDIDDL